MDAQTNKLSARLRSPLGWLTAQWRHFAHEPEHLLAYVMILPTIIAFVLVPRDLPSWRFYGVILSLAVLLTLNVIPQNNRSNFERGGWDVWRFLLISAALFLTAFWMSSGPTFIPFVLFLLIGQATWGLHFPQALGYTIVVTAGFLATIGAAAGAAQAIDTLTNIVPGIVFVMSFSLLTSRYGEQKEHAEELLRQLQGANAELEAAREREKQLAVAEERLRLARDIHDGLGHHLTVLKVQLQAAEKLIERDPQRAAQAIAICRDEAHAALEDVRQSVATLRRTPLDGQTLDSALARLVNEFDQRSALTARLSLHGTLPTLSQATALTLYRAAQEGLTNAQKHAAASNVLVTLTYQANQLTLTVSDDGHTPAPTGASSGYGLAGLRERAEQLGGSFSAAPRPTGGFELVIRLPAKD